MNKEKWINGPIFPEDFDIKNDLSCFVSINSTTVVFLRKFFKMTFYNFETNIWSYFTSATLLSDFCSCALIQKKNQDRIIYAINWHYELDPMTLTFFNVESKETEGYFESNKSFFELGKLTRLKNESNTFRIFELVNIHNDFKRYFVKIKSITHIIIRRNSFRIIVDHNSFSAHLSKSFNASNSTTIKFY